MLHSRRIVRFHLRTLTVIALACIAATGAACGSDEDDGGGGGASTQPAAQKPTGAPIKVGFPSIELGAQAIPQAREGEEAAISRINDARGGINGRPLEVVVCPVDFTPEKNIACANRFVREKVVAVIDGFDYGINAALPILRSAKIPVVGAAPFTAQGDAARDAFYFGPGQAAYSIGPLQSFKQQDLTKVTFAGADTPAQRGYYEQAITPTARAMGLEFTPVYFPVASPNYTTIASSIASTEPNVGGASGLADEGQCTSLINALRSTGFTEPIFAGFCTQFLETVGAKAGDVQVYSQVWLPPMKKFAPAEVKEQLEMAEEDLEKVGDPEKQGFFAYATYSTVMTFADVLKSIKGEVTPQSVTTALRNTKDLPSFLGPKITCDHSVWPKSSSCSDELIFAETQPDGSLKPLNGGFETIAQPPRG